MTSLNQLPHSVETEKLLLNAIFINPKKLHEVIEESITPESFYVPAHGLIFEAILELDRHGQPVDYVQVTEFLTKTGALERVGGPTGIINLHDGPALTVDTKKYARIVAEKATLRNAVTSLYTLLEAAKTTTDVDDFLAQFQEAALRCVPNATSESEGGLLDGMYQELSRKESGEAEPEAIPTGFKAFDRLTGGLNKGELIVVAGRPGMGKSSFATSIIQNIAKHDFKALIFSMEMSKKQVSRRVLAGISRIPFKGIYKGNLSTAGDRLAWFAQSKKITVVDSSHITCAQIYARCRRFIIENKGLDLVVIDYLGLIRVLKPSKTRERDVAEISRDLRNLASELKVPVLLLSQLNRASETRVDQRPLMSDLRESGQVEQDADVVVLIYREKDSKDKGILEIEVAKNRNGNPGKFQLKWEPELTLFKNI